MKRNIIDSVFKNAPRFFSTSVGKGAAGVVTTVFGFVINAIVLDQNKVFVCQILDEIRAVNENVNIDQIEKVIEAFFSPWSLSNIIYAILWFFVGIVLADLISKTDSHKKSAGTDWKNENIIVNLLDHLTDQVYNRCSNCADNCGQCNKLASEDDGLIRRYLYEDSQHLKQAISKSKAGEYSLDNNIPKYHTFAITHMLQTFGEQYSVLQWVGDRKYSDESKYDETFDSLDFDFLYMLLKMVTEPFNGRDSDPYYKIKLSGEKFKIKWVLIGNLECMKNNYDYIFYVIKKLQRDEHIDLQIISSFFEFYIINGDRYKEKIDEIDRSNNIDPYKDILHLRTEPNLGIFGNQFMFIDSLDKESHGSIYTKKYKWDEHSESLLDVSIYIFNRILNHSNKLNFSELLSMYEKIIKEDPEWENQLKTIWKKR